MKSNLILLIEDNEDLMNINRRFLRRLGFQTLEAGTLEAGEAALSAGPDLIVLDIMMPDGSGLEFCKRIRLQNEIPILFLTALSGADNAIAGFIAGGDDYLTKPYDLQELGYRIEALLRRSGKLIRRRTAVGQLTLDHISSRAYIDGQDLMLKPKEFSILFFLTTNAGRFVPSEVIYQTVWGGGGNDTRTVKAHIYRLRKCLIQAENNRFIIEFERGRGYRLIQENY